MNVADHVLPWVGLIAMVVYVVRLGWRLAGKEAVGRWRRRYMQPTPSPKINEQRISPDEHERKASSRPLLPDEEAWLREWREHGEAD